MTPEQVHELSDRELHEALYTGFENFTEDYRQLRKVVYGNGEPGLIGEVRDLKKHQATIDAILMKFATPLMIALVLALLGFVWALITHSATIVTVP